jgi:anti-sigma-K factor RskA
MSMTPRSHDEIEVLVAADALGGLEPEGRAELDRLQAEHGPDCAECRRLENEYREVAGLLATSLEPAAVSPGAEERLMAAVRETPQQTSGIVAHQDWPSSVIPGRTGKGNVIGLPARTRRWIAAAAVAAVLAVLGGVVGYSLAPSNGAPGTRAIAFPATNGQQLTVVYQPGQTQAWIVGANLAQPTNGQVYELWYILPDNPHPQAAGTFVPSNGSAVAPVTVGTSFAALAVSVEPAGGSTTAQGPRGEVILQATA